MVHLRINERIGWCAPHGFEACDLNGRRGGILSEKRRRRAAQAPGGTGGRVPHFPRLEPKWLRLSLSLSISARGGVFPPKVRPEEVKSMSYLPL